MQPGRRWRGRGHDYGQRDAGTRASRSQATALPSAARASLRLHLCHRSRRGGLGAPAHRVRGASAARAAGARSTRDLRRGADHPAPVSDARRLDFSIGARRLPRIAAHATSPLYFPQLAPRQEAGPAHPSCTLSHYPLISLPDSNNSTHSPSPFPCLPRSKALGGRWCAGRALRIAALATPWEISHAWGRCGHVLCEDHAHAFCYVAWHARGAE